MSTLFVLLAVSAILGLVLGLRFSWFAILVELSTKVGDGSVDVRPLDTDH